MRAGSEKLSCRDLPWFVDDLLPRMEKFSDHYYEKYLRGLQATLDMMICTRQPNGTMRAARQIYRMEERETAGR